MSVGNGVNKNSGRLDRHGSALRWGSIKWFYVFWDQWGGHFVLFLVLLLFSFLDAMLTPLALEGNPLLQLPALFLLFKTFLVPIAGVFLCLCKSSLPLLILDGIYLGVLFWHLIWRLILF